MEAAVEVPAGTRPVPTVLLVYLLEKVFVPSGLSAGQASQGRGTTS